MSIFPLQQFEADLAEADREAYERLKPPTSIVVRFGSMKMVGEFPYDGDAKPGCGSKLVVKTHRGVEVGEMLTSTCPNSGCSKSVTRQQMLEYIENSGGPDYPFTTEGRVIRIATIDDLNRQSALDATRPDIVRKARALVDEHDLPMKIVDAEPILGGEVLTLFFTSEHRIDFRELVRAMAREFHARIELRQVGARDEARLIADYERCGQHCCCKNFLKVLKPVSMKSAKVQKATLDPLKISGRCGRLMCCLRYEDETYDSLKKNLPRRGTRVGTPEGVGVVIDTQILTQLVLVDLDPPEGDPNPQRKQVAVPVEDLVDPADAPKRASDPFRGMRQAKVERRVAPSPDAKDAQQDAYRERAQRDDARQQRGPKPRGTASEIDEIMSGLDADAPPGATPGEPGQGPAPKKRKRRRKKKPAAPGDAQAGSPAPSAPPDAQPRQPREPRAGDRAPGDERASSSRPGRNRRSKRGRRRRDGRGDSPGPAPGA